MSNSKISNEFILNKLMEFDSRISKVETTIEAIREDIQEIKYQLSNLQETVSKITGIETSLEDIMKFIENSKTRNQNSNTLKYVLYILIVILSFIATLFGLGWRPPTP